MALLKCKLCHAPLDIIEGASIVKCKYCDSVQTVPCLNNSKKVALFDKANQLRSECEFDKAHSMFESIVVEFPKEAEAYWGLVLCKYGIEYVDDPKEKKKVPTCHRSSYASVLDDVNYKKALEYATSEAREVYVNEANVLENIRKGIIARSSKQDAYDIFICFKDKSLTNSEERTRDSVLAQDVYKALTKEGYKVFFSRITLEGKLGVDYEPIIFSALHSSKVMLAVGTCAEHYNAVWVKNEWSRYLKLIEAGEDKTLIPCFENISPYDMPKEFAHLQGQDLKKVGAIQDLIHGISKIVKPSNGVNAKIKKTLALAKQFLADEEFKNAKDEFLNILHEDIDFGEAYLGIDMANMGVTNHIALAERYAYENKPFSANLKHAREKMVGADWIKEFDETYEKALVIAEAQREKDRVANEAKRKQEEEKRILETAVIVRFEGNTDAVVWKHPNETYTTGIKLVVGLNQAAVLYYNGEYAQSFGVGEHFIHPNECTKKVVSVYFVSEAALAGNKWGTFPKPQVHDTINDAVFEIGSHGSFAYKVADAKSLIDNYVGMVSTYEPVNADVLSNKVKADVRTRFGKEICKVVEENKINVLGIDSHIKSIAELVKLSLDEYFESKGVQLVSFVIGGVIPPQNDATYDRLLRQYIDKSPVIKQNEIDSADELIREKIQAKKGQR